MLKKALELLKKIEHAGYKAYIVGGFVRDYCLDKKSLDIDICTNAKPKDIVKIFESYVAPDIQYGSVTVIYKNVRFEITTFRKEIKYEDNRRPVKIKYIDELNQDLIRRDFTINTLCMDSQGNIVDLLNAQRDLNKRIIKTVGNPRYRLKEDALRILRAIRFATILNFNIDSKTKRYIRKYSYLLRKLSYHRKREELDKIFLSTNVEYGVKLITELGLDRALEIPNLKSIKLVDNIIGIWAQLNVATIYPFTKLEKEQIIKINELQKLDLLDNYVLYHYGLYVSTIVADIKGIDKKLLNIKHSSLPIRSIKEINISNLEIASLLEKEPGGYLKDIFADLEKKIINKEINNDKDSIKQYLINQYKEHSLN